MTLTFADPTSVLRDPTRRTIKTEWLVRADDDGSRQLAQLSVSHHPNTKAFVATLYRVRDSQSGAFRVQGYALMDGVTVHRERAARFNAREFEGFYERAILRMQEIVVTNERAAAIFDPAGPDVAG